VDSIVVQDNKVSLLVQVSQRAVLTPWMPNLISNIEVPSRSPLEIIVLPYLNGRQCKLTC
jgi:hypothetical protein